MLADIADSTQQPASEEGTIAVLTIFSAMCPKGSGNRSIGICSRDSIFMELTIYGVVADYHFYCASRMPYGFSSKTNLWEYAPICEVLYGSR
tara:strand:- start:214 stop:489 length:276 start_codon:yes stop_codon:yes gene_type:complete